ncbi:MAG: hypothetical protein ACTSP4_09505 [Candidatus Hodarchaeales archaeon]
MMTSRRTVIVAANVSLISGILFSGLSLFSYLYISRSTGMLPVISYPFKPLTLPFFVAGLLFFVISLILRYSAVPRNELIPIDKNELVIYSLFIMTGLLMKIAGEIVHEVLGHCSAVLFFGGKITGIYISLLWPLELSKVKWVIIDLDPMQKVLVSASGIFACLLVSFAIQVVLILKKNVNGKVRVFLFWLSFWCFVNSTGYLIMGSFSPFGDVRELIDLGVLSAPIYLIVGSLFFLVGFYSLSQILRMIITPFHEDRINMYSFIFWFIIPALTGLTVASNGLPVLLTLLGFIPVILSYLLEFKLEKIPVNSSNNECKKES